MEGLLFACSDVLWYSMDPRAAMGTGRRHPIEGRSALHGCPDAADRRITLILRAGFALKAQILRRGQLDGLRADRRAGPGIQLRQP